MTRPAWILSKYHSILHYNIATEELIRAGYTGALVE